MPRLKCHDDVRWRNVIAKGEEGAFPCKSIAGGALRDVLETLNISFVGSSAAASRLAFDKPVAASLVSGTGIAVPEFVVLPQSTFRELGALAMMHAVGQHIGFPS